jgi:hypothetical protein
LVGSRFFVGLDLGQAVDYTAFAVLERQVTLGELDRATYERPEVVSLRLRYVERMALDTPYPAVVERMYEVVRSSDLLGRCDLVVDGTGVGRPVVDFVQTAGVGCRVWPVSITPGERESYSDGYYRVPKRDLVTKLQLLLQRGALQIAGRMKDGEMLLREMREMRVRVTDEGREQFGVWRSGEHDDLVLAAALSVWAATKVLPRCGDGLKRVV